VGFSRAGMWLLLARRRRGPVIAFNLKIIIFISLVKSK
jgi:hypothetical protein